MLPHGRLKKYMSNFFIQKVKIFGVKLDLRPILSRYKFNTCTGELDKI